MHVTTAIVLTLAAAVSAQQAGQSGQPKSRPTGVPSTHGFTNPSIHASSGGLAMCVSGLIPVTATASNLKFNTQIPVNQSVFTAQMLALLSVGSPVAAELMDGMQTITGTYNIYGCLCTPADSADIVGVQFASHGVGFDHTYWDFAPGYSYVDAAASNNYATFIYDRLGVGRSSTPDALNVVQAPLEVSIAKQLISGLRAGNVSGGFDKIVGVGHSFGSIIMEAITATEPDLLDAAILTGFGVDSTGVPPFLLANNFAIASQDQPDRFGGLSNGYFVPSTLISTQTAFFRGLNFDASILSRLDSTKGSVTVGELLTITTEIAPASKWTKPVAVVNGAEDLPFCFGNCTYPSNKAQAVFGALYPATTKTGVYLAPNTGHGVNLHYSAGRTFKYIQDFLNKNL